MARGDSKGQQVKTFKHFVPTEDAKHYELIGKIYFQADSGDFVIYLPEHIARVAESLREARDDRHDKGLMTRGAIQGKTMDGVKDFYTTTLVRYQDLIRAQTREKVIRVYYERNLAWNDNTKDHLQATNPRSHSAYPGGAQISFTGSPALFLSYDVLWRAGDALYTEDAPWHNEPAPAIPRLRYKERVGEHGKAKFIPWTEEREAFFAAMKAKIEELIMRLDVFTADLSVNADLALARMGASLALPAPNPLQPGAIPVAPVRVRNRENPPPIT